MEQPFFSIVMPTYNRAKIIGKAVESIISQTYPNWELVIVDDGSTDNTEGVVAAYKEPRIKYIKQANAERSAARNNGIKNATGQYICFLDSDDYFLPSRLQQLFDTIGELNFPVAFLYTPISFETETGIWDRPELENTFDKIQDFVAQAIIGNPQACIENTILAKHRYNEKLRIGEDMELWMRITAEYPLIFIPYQYTVVATDQGDRSVNERKNNVFLENYETYELAFSHGHPGSATSKKVKNTMRAISMFGIARYHIHNGNKAKAISYLFKSILFDPAHKQTKYKINLLLKCIRSTKAAEAILETL